MRQDGVSLYCPSGFTIHRLKAQTREDELIVTQLLAMEKKLWKKTDSWGGLLEKELTRRNTFTLYVTTTLPSLPSSALPANATHSSSVTHSLKVVAYLIFTATGLVCHISKVVVVPEMRRQGLGRALVQAAIEIAKNERRVGSITLHVDADNTAALGLYSSTSTAEMRIFHCAYFESGQGAVEDCRLNLTMLKNVVEAAETNASDSNTELKHVFTMEGTKWYGQQFLEPLKTPFNENDGRHIGPNFYYDLEDYLRSRTGTLENNGTEGITTTGTSKAAWTWSALRPGPVIGFSTGSYMSLLPSIAVYGCLCKELGLEMRFPGTNAAYTAPMEVCNADVLAEAMVFVSTTPAAENRAFNINNGDFFRWDQVWPRLAEWFGVKAGPPLKVGDLTQVMGEYKYVWEGLVENHGLNDTPYEKLATWKFMGFVFSMPESGWFSNTVKLRKAGFHGMVVDSGESMIEKLETLRRHKIIP
ncbi:hypothetical protein KSW81_000869 [Nannochloris sp. 'desiccata']|nr:hypothetical protein KSW81_000869 [Chlorella desiccata (nom. nud.)]